MGGTKRSRVGEARSPRDSEGGETDAEMVALYCERVLEEIDLVEDSKRICLTRSRIDDDLNSYSILKKVPLVKKVELVNAASNLNVLNRAMGSMCGMGIGDALGHPFEFLPTQDKVSSDSPHFDLRRFRFVRESNKFNLKRGQWTDDATMGLCMADSLILRRGFDGSDMRVRFWCWWNRGYNNAFRKDPKRSSSVGLGGNISNSLNELTRLKDKTEVAAAFGASSEDAGNGSLMRFTPVALFLHSADMEEVHEIARKSSYTTHPGIIAAEACSFLAHLIVTAVRLPPGEPSNVQSFLDKAAASYLTESGLARRTGWGYDQMKWLVTSTPTKDTERCWNWKSEKLEIQQTLKARGNRYNGYPVLKGYFGAFSLDGLAMALWSVYHTRSFDEAVARSVNLLGDADSHGSITGQLAGAIYGYRSINQQFIKWLTDWDDYEFAVRGVLLHHLGQNREKQ